MKHALEFGNRLIMMHEGHIVKDVSGEEKSRLTTENVIQMFKDNADSIEDRFVLGL
jgi:putative ABC transport system ATP-binding protein